MEKIEDTRLIKLYDLSRNTRIGVAHLDLRYEKGNKLIEELNFHHVDGMYSLCTDDSNNTIHLNCTTEVRYLGKATLNPQ